MPTITELQHTYRQGSTTPSQVVKETLETITEKDGEIQAYLSVFETEAQNQAQESDRRLAEGNPRSHLEGIPISIKDAILVHGQKTTSGSRMLENYTAPYNATVIEKLQDAGAIILGKTNMDEFAMGSSTENSAFQVTRNPHDPSRVPGGSSGGSAASVAADMAVTSLGSDTGGSIRQPAALTGVVGLKPTYGRVSRSGLIAMASSLDQIGPFSQTCLDAAQVLKVIEGQDDLDATSASLTGKHTLNIEKIQNTDPRNLTIGLPEEYFIEGLSAEVKQAVDEVIEQYKALGATFKTISLPHSQYAISAYYILMPAEVSTNLARFDGIVYGLSHHQSASNLLEVYMENRSHGFGMESKRRIMLGTSVLSSGYYDDYYNKAKQMQKLITDDFQKAFTEVDAILTPTTPHTAFPIGEKTDDPVAMYLEDVFTVATNIAGIPGISIPAPSDTLPIGFQLMTPHFDENTLLGLGHAYDDHYRQS